MKLYKTLESGLEVFVNASDFAPLVSLQLTVKAGSVQEDPADAGVAHFLEHMLFKGSRLYPLPGQIADTVERVGGDMNAYTTFDHTCYYINAPAHFAKQGLGVLWEMVTQSLLTSEEIDKERGVILEEVSRGEDNPSHLVFQNLFGGFYGSHPLGRPVIGLRETVAKLTPERIRAFYETWYQPKHMILVAAGDVDPSELVAHAQGLPSPRSRAPAPSIYWGPGDLPREVVTIHRGAFEAARLSLAVPGPCLEDESAPTWEVLGSVLGDGDTSRFTEVLRNQLGLVTSADASLFSPAVPRGAFSLGLLCQPHSLVAALEATMGVLRQVAHTAPDPGELARVVSAIRAGRIYAKESCEGVGREATASLLTSHKLTYMDWFLSAVERVTPAQVQDVARQVLRSIEGGTYALSLGLGEAMLQDLTPAALRVALAPPKAAILAASSPLRPSLHKDSVQTQGVRLPSGAELRFNHRSSRRLPVASGVLVWRPGAAHEPPGQSGSTGLLARLLTRGTQRQSQRVFAARLEELASSVQGYASKDTITLRFDSLADHALETLRMMCECLFLPALDPKEFSVIQKEQLDVLQAQQDSPGAHLSRVWGPLVYGAHPYGLPSMGTRESIARASLEDLQGLWTRRQRADRFVFALAGDCDPEAALEILAGVAGQWRLPPGGLLAEPRLPLPSLGEDRTGFGLLEREQAHILVGTRGVPLGDPRRIPLEVGISVLSGQSGRLFMDLRDTQSLAYSVGASQTPLLEGGTVSGYIGTHFSKAQEAVRGVARHIAAMAQCEVTAEELERAKQSLIGSQTQDSQHTSYQASQLATGDVHGLPFDQFLTFGDRVRAVQANEIQEAFAHLISSPPRCAVVGPAGTYVPGPTELTWEDA